MTQAIFMQYVGFESKDQGREYAFQVRYGAQDVRDYTVTIAGEAFVSGRLRYQDGPNVCSSRLKRELTGDSNLPTGTAFLVTDLELEDYNSRHSPKPKSAYGPKPRKDW
jgi:hypothetical protein